MDTELRSEPAPMRMRLSARLTGEGGFTLVEMMVAILLLAIIFSAMVSVIITSLTSMQREEQRVRATQLAQEELERLRALDWDCVGFDPAGGPYADYNGNTTVTYDASACAAPGTAPSFTPVTRTVDGVDYTVTYHVYWLDDPEDGTAPTDTEPQDYKEFTVDVDWALRGEAFTYSTSSTRIPTVAEVPLSTTAAPSTFEITGVAINPSVVDIDASSQTTEDATVDVTTSLDATVVTLEIPGVYGPVNLTGSGTAWQWVIPVGTAVTAGTFNAQISATGGSGSDTATTPITFAQASASPVVINTPLIDPAEPICVENDGDTRFPVTLTIDVDGLTASDPVNVSWTDQAGSAVATPVEATAAGYKFEALIPQSTKFNKSTTTVTVTAKRTGDSVVAQEAYTYAVSKNFVSTPSPGYCL